MIGAEAEEAEFAGGPERTENPAREKRCISCAEPAGRPRNFPCRRGGLCDGLNRSFEFGMILLAAQAEREGQVTRADEDDIKAGRGDNLVDVIKRAGLLR